MSERVCEECGLLLEQPRFGRRRKRHPACKKRALRRRRTSFGDISAPVSAPPERITTPISAPDEPMPWWEKEALGLFPGGSWADYLAHTGRTLGGAPVHASAYAEAVLKMRGTEDA